MEMITLEPVLAYQGRERIDRRGAADPALATGGFDFAGWVAVLAAATSVPLLTFDIALSTLGGDALIARAGLKVLDAGLCLYLLVALRRLNGRRGFHPADSVIVWWAGFAAFFCAINVLLPAWSAQPFVLAALVVAISTAVLFDIVLGVMLFRLNDDPCDCLKAYAFSHITAGVCIIASTLRSMP